MIKARILTAWRSVAAGINAQIIKNIIGAFFVRGGAMIVTLCTMPAYMRYFQDDKVLGTWFALVSLLNWVITFDLGIGNGLRNKLVGCFVRGNYADAKRYISSAYLAVSALTLVIFLWGVYFIPRMDWNGLLNIARENISEEILRDILLILFIGVLVKFVLKLITSILYALQKSAVNNLLELISSVLLLLYVCFSEPGDAALNLRSLAYAHAVLSNIPFLLATVIIFVTVLRKAIPSMKRVRGGLVREILSTGSTFLLAQVMFMAVAATNEILISGLDSPAHVVDYQVYYKLFTLMGSLLTLALTPIWSAVTKAQANKDYLWISKLNRILRRCVALMGAINFMVIPFLQPIVDIWLGDGKFVVNYGYAGVFALYGAVFIWHAYICSLANGMGQLKIQVIFLTLAALAKAPVAYICVRVFGGYIGVIIATILVLLPFEVVQPIWFQHYITQKAENC